MSFGATAKRAKHEAPRHSHFQLGGQFRSLVRTLCVCQGIQWGWVKCRNFYSKWQPHLMYIYICHSHTSFYHHLPSTCTYIWPQLRARCAGEEAVPSTCVGDARPCAGRGTGRARSAVPRSDRAKSKRARSALALAAKAL